MWLNYLTNKLQENEGLLNDLYEIDYEYYDSIYSPSYLFKYIEKNINVNKFFNFRSNDITFLLEGSSTALISVINDYYDKKIEVIVNDENVAINKWIKKAYNDFCKEYMLSDTLNIMITNHFKVNTNNVIVIGSNAFMTEMKRCLKDKNLICYEYEE